MITLRKLQTLAPDTRRRKIARLLEGMIRSGEIPSGTYVAGLLGIISRDEGFPPEVRQSADAVMTIAAQPEDSQKFLRSLNTLRHAILSASGISSGDWDLLPPGGFGATDPPETPRLASPISLYLDSIRSPFNLGSIVRTAVAFGVTGIGMSVECPPVDHPRVVRTAMGTLTAVDLVRESLGTYAGGRGPLVALEVGGVSLDEYRFPEKGILIVGSEELGIREEYLEMADATISIPLPGPKASINVGVACGIALQRWTRSLTIR